MNYKTILFFLLISPCAVYAQPSTKSFLEHIDSDKYDSYLYGLESGLDWANEFTYRKHNYEIFCKPNDFELSASNLKSLIIAEINNNPDFYTKYSEAPLIGLALRNAYQDNFPCN